MSVAGEGSWIKAIASTDNNGNIKLMIVNYDSKGTHTESVPVLFENLPKMNFKFTRRDFLGATRTQQVATSEANWKSTELFSPNSAAMFTMEF